MITGADLSRTLAEEPPGGRYLLPDVCLSKGRFIDGPSLEDLPLAVEVVATDGASLAPALGGGPMTRGRSPRLPIVAVVGRPNVGKSTLVNRIAGRQLAIVEARPGVTRDRLEVECEWNGRSFLVVDTGGVVERGDTLDTKVTEQALRALGEADLVLLVLDTTTGVTGDDTVVAQLVRRERRGGHRGREQGRLRPAGGRRLGVRRSRARRAGDGERACTGRGVGDLLDEVVKQLLAVLRHRLTPRPHERAPREPGPRGEAGPRRPGRRHRRAAERRQVDPVQPALG